MSKILVVTGSVRPNSVNKVVVGAIMDDLKERENVTATIADLGKLDLPFYDAPASPSSDDYKVPHDIVKQWAELVDDADGVVFASPEYNHSLSAVQKNAIDWLYTEWNDKPVAFVGYGWHEGGNSLNQFKEIGKVTQWKLGLVTAGLQFMKELNPDGSFADEAATRSAIKATLDELVNSL